MKAAYRLSGRNHGTLEPYESSSKSRHAGSGESSSRKEAPQTAFSEGREGERISEETGDEIAAGRPRICLTHLFLIQFFPRFFRVGSMGCGEVARVSTEVLLPRF